MSRLTLDAASEKNGFLKMPKSSERTPDLWVPKQALLDLDTLSENHDDLADIARLFHGCPYEYGGRAAWGVDCSGLVQLALQSRNIFCPRDADQQESALLGDSTGYKPDYGQTKLSGTLVEDFNACRRGDLIFFNDKTKEGRPTIHVGIVEEQGKVMNANTRYHRVVAESLDAMMDHYRHGSPKETAIRSIWRLQL